jgi:hypothetical protein
MDSAKEFCPHSMFERANAFVAHSVKYTITTMLTPQVPVLSDKYKVSPKAESIPIQDEPEGDGRPAN